MKRIIWEGCRRESCNSFWFILGFLVIALLILFSGCASTGEIKVSDPKETVWFASFDPSFAFQGKFVSVYYSETNTIGLKLEEPLGIGWKKLGVKEGDIWMGITGFVLLRSEDWRKVWALVKTKMMEKDILVGILKFNLEGSYEKEITWYLLKR